MGIEQSSVKGKDLMYATLIYATQSGILKKLIYHRFSFLRENFDVHRHHIQNNKEEFVTLAVAKIKEASANIVRRYAENS